MVALILICFFGQKPYLWTDLELFCAVCPLFLGAMAIGLAYLNYVSRIGTLYFADLFGSGLGGLLMLFLFWHFAPASLPFVIALLPLLGGILLLKSTTFTKFVFSDSGNACSVLWI